MSNIITKCFIALSLSFLLTSNLYSQDGAWRELESAPKVTGRMDDFFFINANTGWTGANQGGSGFKIYKTSNGGLNWTAISDQVPALRSIHFIDSLNGLVGTVFSDVTKIFFRTTDGGYTWNSILNNVPEPKPKGVCGIYSINGSHIFAVGRYIGDARFIKSTDGGNTWSSQDLMPYLKGAVDCYFYNKDTGFVTGWVDGTSFGNGKGRILYTTNGGANWEIKATTQTSGQIAWKIAPTKEGYIYVALEKFGSSGPTYFFKSTNRGETWTENIFLDTYFNAQGIGFINANTGWYGSFSSTTYKTTDAGATWGPAEPFLNSVNRIRFVNDSVGYASGKSIYKYESTLTSVKNISTEIPSSLSLEQNYPNPFNPTTTIHFKVDKPRNVKIEVYNVLGNMVSKLTDSRFQAGTYSVNFNGSNVSSGVYFVKLSSEDVVYTRRMMLVK